VIGIVFGLGFVLSFGYWTTNFAEVQRALSAKDMSAARRTPIIGAFPKTLLPLVIVIPGMLAGVLAPELIQLKQGASGTGVTYNNALELLIRDLLPNGMLGIAITGLLASFMAGMAANISSLNTVFTYDLWQDYVVKNRPDEYYLRVGRTVTVVGTIIAMGTAFIAGGYSNLMDYVQSLFSFFNAPLFATFILGMFWKRMTPAAGWSGLVAGTVAAILVDLLNKVGTLHLAGQGASFVGASAAFIVDIAVSVVVSLATRPKPEAELTGLVWSLTPRSARQHEATGENAGWYRSPVVLAVIVAIMAVALNLIFA
jgi:SSS family solute:Na+ symporter